MPDSCDYYIVEYPGGFALLEWYGGALPEEDDIIVGPFDGYGMKTVFNVTNDAESRVWVEDYALAWEDALEQLFDECD